MQRYPCPAQLLLVADGYLGCAAVGVYSGECNLRGRRLRLRPHPLPLQNPAAGPALGLAEP